MADFCLVSRRVLDEQQYKIFKYHYLLGADWKLCCRKLGMERGAFFHEAYRIEQKLGRTFRELKPFALYPLDEYFSSTGREEPKRVVLQFPVQREDSKPIKPVLAFPLNKQAA